MRDKDASAYARMHAALQRMRMTGNLLNKRHDRGFLLMVYVAIQLCLKVRGQTGVFLGKM